MQMHKNPRKIITIISSYFQRIQAKPTVNQIYMACKQHGLITSYGERSRTRTITFKRSARTDSIKPTHTIRIGDCPVVLKWKKDYSTSSGPILASPAQVTDQVPQPPIKMLDVLNDDCLHVIFTKLPMVDLYEQRYVCQRFQDVAIHIRPPNRIDITDDNCKPLWKLHRLIRTFGTAIEIAHITTNQSPDILMGFLSQYCRNIVDLKGEIRFGSTLPEMTTIYSRLTRLHLKHVGTFEEFDQLNIDIESIRVDSIVRLPPFHFPYLRELQVDTDYTMDISSMEEFFNLNIGIEKLVLGKLYRCSLSFMRDLPNLREFQAISVNLNNVDNVDALSDCSRLENLRLLMATGDIDPTLRAFAQHGSRLEHLTWTKAVPGYNENVFFRTEYRVEYLKSLQTRGVLTLELLQLAQNCVNLRVMDVNSVDLFPTSIWSLLYSSPYLGKATFDINVSCEYTHKLSEQIEFLDRIAEARAHRSIDLQVIYKVRSSLPKVGCLFNINSISIVNLHLLITHFFFQFICS